jgi:cellulose synthase/poly-beta-1,6-N-acetylglucosamine synthase-like glycosyltransferase
MTYFSIALFILSSGYGLFIFRCFLGWRKLKIVQPSSQDPKTSVTVIVPARNEENTIEECLLNILNQNYPHELTEIIVADDLSTDHTGEVVCKLMAQFPDRNLFLLNNQTGGIQRYKKQAIANAIKSAKGELIITTDADCSMRPAWLSSIVKCYESEYPELISGPVCFHGEKNIFQKIQNLEFIGLIGIGAGCISNHHPIMCNGANLAYTKKIFYEVNGFNAQSETVSGDDTQLLLKMAAKDASKIRFLKSEDAIVYTSAVHSLNDLFHQRKRWASKISGRMGSSVLQIAAMSYLAHFGLLLALVFCFFHPSILPVFFSCFVLKSVPEFIFLNSLSSFFKKRNLLWLFWPFQVMYWFYISFIGIVAPFSSYRWKERKIRTDQVNMGVLKKK